jgi:hypothetical protein
MTVALPDHPNDNFNARLKSADQDTLFLGR